MKKQHILTFFILLLAIVSHAQPYKNLVMKGGGIRGIAYCGALEVLENLHMTSDIEKVGGTSVGAIVGTLFSVGYTAQEIKEIMLELKIQTFNDGEWFFIGGQKRMRKNYGWYKGNKLEQWLGKLIKAKTGDDRTTFVQLHKLAMKDKRFKDLYVTATNLTLQRPEVFSYGSYPNLPINVAVRASASVPLYYGAVFIDSSGHYSKKPITGGRYNVFTDGGLLANYPITLFNDAGDKSGINTNTLGLKLDRPEQIANYGKATGLAPYNISSFKNYLGALYNVTIEQLNPSLPYDIERKNTIYISNGNLSPRVRHVTAVQKDKLFNNGKVAAQQFFGMDSDKMLRAR